MKKILRSLIVLVSIKNCLISFLLFYCGAASAAVWYVKPVAAGSGNGVSWANAAGAAQLATIIQGAASGDQVWVVGTTSGAVYYPTTGTSRTAAFTLKSGVAVYGGFTGTETALGQQDPAIYISILSGDIGVVGNNSDNSYNVVVSTNVTGATLSGFTITNGNANGTGQNSTGGGIYNSDGSSSNTLTFANCIITGNLATGDGGGVYNTGGGITFTSCTFSGNTSSAEGGGMYTYGSGNGNYTLIACAFSNNKAAGNGGGYCVDNGSLPVTLTNCVFSSNKTTTTAYNTGGGGVYVTNGSITMTGCAFKNNSSSGYGGGMIINQGSNQPISYCTFTSNSAAIFGGGLACIQGSAPIVSNCNFSSNVAEEGAGIYNISGSPTFKYDTLFGNTATAVTGTGGAGMCSDTSANPIVSHCWFNANVTNGSYGAGLFEQSSAGNDSNCVFQANIAKGTASNGGGLYHSNGTSKVWNSVFLNNSCTGGYGGGIYNNNANSTYEHLTLYNNSSTASTSTTGFGDGIYVASGNPKIDNDIVWSTTTTSIGVVYVSTITSYKVQYSDVQNGTLFASGTGNVTSAPTFGAAGNPVGPDNIWATADDGLHLTGSAASEAVTPGNFLADDITDFPRPETAPNADMGAYEGGGTFLVLFVNSCVLTAVPDGSGGTVLNWQTVSTDGAAQFMVERSDGAGVFQSIAVIPAVDGQGSYRYADRDASGGVVSYRVELVGKDSTDVFSNIASLTVTEAGYLVSLRPSVIHSGMSSLYLTSPHPALVNIVLADGSGRILKRYSVSLSGGSQTIPLEGLHFAAGVYYLYLRSDDGFVATIPLELL
jgi:hypothetical protein